MDPPMSLSVSHIFLGVRQCTWSGVIVQQWELMPLLE
jgi:hypothetical protein